MNEHTTQNSPAFAVGDQVIIKRNLKHPANMIAVQDYNPYDGDHRRWIPDPNMANDEILGRGVLKKCDRKGYRHKGHLYLEENHFFYHEDTGYQHGCEATLIEKVQP